MEAEDVAGEGDRVADEEGEVKEYGHMWKSMGIRGMINNSDQDAMR